MGWISGIQPLHSYPCNESIEGHPEVEGDTDLVAQLTRVIVICTISVSKALHYAQIVKYLTKLGEPQREDVVQARKHGSPEDRLHVR